MSGIPKVITLILLLKSVRGSSITLTSYHSKQVILHHITLEAAQIIPSRFFLLEQYMLKKVQEEDDLKQRNK